MTHSNARAGKTLVILAMIFLFILPSALSYDACRDKQSSDAIPCVLLFPSGQNCSNILVNFYNTSTYLSSQNMSAYSPFVCSANFTYNTTGTYNFNYSTGDSGVIVVEEGNKMIYLLYFGLAMIVLLMVLGLWKQDQRVLLIDGLLMLVIGVWIFINGFSIYNNMVTQMIGTVIFGLGMYFSFMAGMSMIEGE